MFEGEVVLQRPARRYLEKLSLDDTRIINALQILGIFNKPSLKGSLGATVYAVIRAGFGDDSR